MNWWNKNKKPLTIVLISITGVAVVTFVVLQLGHIIGPQYCLMTDPLTEGMHIVLEGSKPESYTIEVEFPSGKRSVICNPETTQKDFKGFNSNDQCMSNGAFFEQRENLRVGDKPPEKLVVTIVFDGKRITNFFQPKYQIVYPDGKSCGYFIYYATIHFDLSE